MKSKNKLPLIANSQINDYVTKSRNRFYFFLRFDKPLHLIEPTKNNFDNSLILTKLQKAKLKAFKIRMKNFQQENRRKNINLSYAKNSYKNLLPIKIWSKCKNIYEYCKHEDNILNNNKSNVNFYTKNNLNIKKITNIKKTKNIFENQGLNKFIKYLDKSFINDIPNNTKSLLNKNNFIKNNL